MYKRAFLPLFLVLVLASCGAATSGRSSGSSTVILADEIAEVGAVTAYEIVERARPQWLNARSSGSPSNPSGAEPVVYVDGVRAGDPGELRRMRPDVVVRMEYLRPSDATNRYGTNHQGGAILVTTR